jgi:hypothetical protein
LRYLAAALRRQRASSGNATLVAASLPALDSCGVPIIVFSIFDLARGDIDDQLRKLSWVARALGTAFGHADNMAWREATRNPMSRGADFRLTHYPSQTVS